MQLAEPIEPETVQACEVWPEHVQALNLLLDCMSQFELAVGMGGAQWQAARNVNVEQMMRWHGVQRRQQPALWQLYRVMQDEALSVLNERQAIANKRK